MKTKTGFILIGLMVLFFVTCRKDKDDPSGGNKMELGVNLIDTLSYFFTGIQTEVISLGENEIIQHGHCWSTESNPTINEKHTLLGKLSSEIDFLSIVDTLLPNTIYYIRPYIQTAYAVAYGEEEQIKTLKTGKPVVLTNPVSDITLTTALSGGIVTSDSGLVVTARGVCWDTTAGFRIDSCLGFTVDSLGLGSFSSEVTGLSEGTNYHIAAYATNEKGTDYGEILTFSTVPITPPIVSTSDITNITTSSAEGGGNVTSDGNGTMTMRGVCWDTLSSPSFENNIGHTEDGSGPGEFTSNITNLHEGKTYYVVAYASNEKGIGYGEIKSFTTYQLTLPSVTTSSVTNITANSAVCGGNVVNNGNGTVISRGVCWNTTGDPTLQNCIDSTSNGSGVGSFTSDITALTTNTTYYVRAYAKNEEGAGYGNQVVFTTLTVPSVTTNAVSNISYTTATSGGNVTNDGGTPVTARGVCWSTSQNPTISDSHTTNGSGTGSFISNITGLTQNTTYYVRAYATNSTGTGYGNQVSFTTLQLTIPSITTNSVTNISYTTAISGGNVTNDGGSIVTARGVCWSSLPDPTTSDPHTNNGAGTGSFVSNITGLTQNTTYYVRAYATNSVGTAYGNQVSFTTLQITFPTVTTSPVTNITPSTATSGGTVIDDGGVAVTERGVCWSTNSNPTISDNFTIDGTGIGSFVSSIIGLVPETDYYVRAYATNTIGTSYGSEFGFTTLTEPCPTSIFYEGQTYNTILIGSQCWLKENLNVGTMILGDVTQTNNSIKEKYCYDNNITICETYGGLYQWDEMMQYINQQGTQGICPPEWHIPTDAEYTTLTDYLGGESIAGGKMKEVGTVHWMAPNTGATNSSGFTAIPGGLWVPTEFDYLGEALHLWTSTGISANAWSRRLYYSNELVYRAESNKYWGRSVRCLKDE